MPRVFAASPRSEAADGPTGSQVRVPVALAITKLLLCLPPRMQGRGLQRVLKAVCYVLRSRAQLARDEARKVRAGQMLKTPFVQSALRPLL